MQQLDDDKQFNNISMFYKNRPDSVGIVTEF